MIIFKVGTREAIFKRVGMCGKEARTQESPPWLRIYSLASGPRVSYRETGQSDCERRANSAAPP
jgi:hypothetical protein